MKRLLTPLVAISLLAPFSAANAESYTRLSYGDLYATPQHSGVDDYLKLSMGTYSSDLDNKAATIGFGWQRSLPSGFGFGVNVNHSLSSSVTENEASDNLELRYISVAPYVNGEIDLLQIDPMTTLKGYARAGASVIKPEGNYAELLYDDIEYGAYYGAGFIVPFAKYGDFDLGVSVQDAIDIVEIQGSVRFVF